MRVNGERTTWHELQKGKVQNKNKKEKNKVQLQKNTGLIFMVLTHFPWAN